MSDKCDSCINGKAQLINYFNLKSGRIKRMAFVKISQGLAENCAYCIHRKRTMVGRLIGEKILFTKDRKDMRRIDMHIPLSCPECGITSLYHFEDDDLSYHCDDCGFIEPME